MKTIYLVMPCYNEDKVIEETNRRILQKINTLINQQCIHPNSRIVYVDDGSKDTTWELISKFTLQTEKVIGLKLSRNQGHQKALLAGLMFAKDKSEGVISLDADLQDDISAIDEMLLAFENGIDIVYGVRKKRESDTFFKRTTAHLFYKFMRIMGVDIVYNHADYRLMSNRCICELEKFDEVNLFLRGIVPLIGFQNSIVYYDRHERYAGESKYPLKKMISFAFEGITSFSIKPIRFILFVSFGMLFVSVAIIFYTLYRYYTGETVAGWAFLNISVWFIAGIQTLLLGIVGEYIGKIYSETKHRPKYIVEKIIGYHEKI